MIRIAMDHIYLTRGDSTKFEIKVYTDIGEVYELEEDDKLYFIVTSDRRIVDLDDLGTNTDNYVFYKEGTTITINPSDTKDLLHNEYYYQVRLLIDESDEVITIIEPECFTLTPFDR